MGKKVGKEKRSKGPRGKKAREIKKLERRWGEVVNEEDIQKARIRKGRHRLTEDESKARLRYSHTQTSTSKQQGPLNKLDQTNPRPTPVANPTTSMDSNHHDDDDDGDSTESHDLYTTQESTNISILQSLLKSIKKKSRSVHIQNDFKHRNKRVLQEEDDDAEEEDDDDEEEEHDSSLEDLSHDVMEEYDDELAPLDENLSMEEEQEEIIHTESSKDTYMEGDDDDNLFLTEYLKKNHQNPFFQHFFPKDVTETSISIKLSQQSSSSTVFQSIPTTLLHPSLQLQLSQQVLDDFQCILYPSSQSHITTPTREEDAPPVSLEKFLQLTNNQFQYCQQGLVQRWKTFNSIVVRKNVDAKSNNEVIHKNTHGLSNHFSSFQSILYPFMTQYVDLLITCETRQNTDTIRNLILLHSLNHILTSQRLISRNNKYLKKMSEKNVVENDKKKNKKKAFVSVEKKEETEDEDESWNVRDQGYTRPKVLILLPSRGQCHVFVQKLLQLLDKGTNVDQLERFEAEYSAPPPDQEEDGPNHTDAEKQRRRKSVLKEKGIDWLELFGDEVNSDDDFKIGLSIQHVNSRIKGTGKDQSPRRHFHVKLYSEFYHCDLILASPLSLKIHSDSQNEDSLDHDFLSSIEICVLCNCDTLLMQNWDHVNSVLNMINQQPKKIQGIDFSRVRDYFLSGLASKFRQLVVVSKFMDANILSTFKKFASSRHGQIKFRRKCSDEEASACNVSVRVPQVFQRILSESFLSQGEDRLKYFTNKVLPHIFRLQQKHTMIYIPSYFDFTAVRNILLKKDAKFVSVTEYSRTSEISRGRAHFLQGRKNIMLYTGRSFFFMRHFIKGVRHLVLFGVPEHAVFYPLLVNMLSRAAPTSKVEGPDLVMNEPLSCLCLFTKYDAHALERIVGINRCEKMIKGEKMTFLLNS